MRNLGLGLQSLAGNVSTVTGSIRIHWDNQYCQNWEDITSMTWLHFNDVVCTSIWKKLTSTKYENETTNWESIG